MIKKEKQLILLDWLKRFLLLKIVFKLKLIKSILLFLSNTTSVYLKASIQYNLLDYRASTTFPKIRCLITSRSHAVNQKTKLSRFSFRRLVSNKSIPFVTRPSW